jgi:hypothetical protein
MKSVIVIGIVLIATPLAPALWFEVINNDLLHNIARVESSHNDKAVSNRGAIGRYQIRYAVWHKELKQLGIIKHKNDLFNRDKNELAARYILNKYYRQTGNLEKTLQRYSGNACNYYRKVMKEDK